MTEKLEKAAYLSLGSRDYARARMDGLGNIVVEFNVWDYEQGSQVVTVLTFVPKEAQLLSEMLLRQADSAASQAYNNMPLYMPA